MNSIESNYIDTCSLILLLKGCIYVIRKGSSTIRFCLFFKTLSNRARSLDSSDIRRSDIAIICTTSIEIFHISICEGTSHADKSACVHYMYQSRLPHNTVCLTSLSSAKTLASLAAKGLISLRANIEANTTYFKQSLALGLPAS
jgi:hypothetical protein